MNNYELANSLFCQNLSSELPGGVTDNRGWYTVKNDHRGERTAGSFGININTGAVEDRGDSSYKGDCVSYYAKINGLGNGEAAKDIIKKYSSFEYDKRYGEKEKTEYKAIVPIPSQKEFEVPIYCENQWPKNVEFIYEYRDTQSRLLYCSVRMKTPVKIQGKNRKVFNVGYFEIKKGIDIKNNFTWYKGVFTGKEWPFSRADKIIKRKSENIVICEGEKAAFYLESILDSSRWIVTTNGSSANLCNPKSYDIFTKAKINSVFFWPDNDDAGESAIDFVAERFDKISIINIPEGMPKGWDAADAVLDGWGSEQIESFIFDNCGERQSGENPYFKIIGKTHTDFVFYSYLMGFRKTVKHEGLNESFLTVIAPDEFWRNRFPNKSGIDWKAARRVILDDSYDVEYYDDEIIRHLGAWEDAGRIIFNYGHGIMYNNYRYNFMKFNTDYIYENIKSIKIADPKEFHPKYALQAINELSIETQEQKYFMAGWLTTAIIGGCLKWRPHCWFSGETGSGKSIGIDLVNKIMGSTVHLESGVSTEAGLRQKLKTSTLPVLIDEMEGRDKKMIANVESIKFLVRLASSGAHMTKGTNNHLPVSFEARSMFLFASINTQLDEGADVGRFAIIHFSKDVQKRQTEPWEVIEERINSLTSDIYCLDFRSWIIRNASSISDIVKKTVSYMNKKGDFSRFSKQFGTLIAGAFILENDGIVFEDQTLFTFVDKFTLNMEREESDKTDAERILNHLFEEVIDVRKFEEKIPERMNIYTLIKMYFEEENKPPMAPSSIDLNCAKKTLNKYGIILGHEEYKDRIVIIHSNKNIKKIFSDTPWAGGIKQVLRTYKYAEKNLSKALYAGVSGAGIIIRTDFLDFEKYGDELPF